jgi:DNA replication and repair protein RecF
VIVTRIELVDFRNYEHAAFDFEAGVTAVVGPNGRGKTNLAEAMAYLSTLDSFRGAPADALIRVGADTAVLRATVRQSNGGELAAGGGGGDAREVLVELELSRHGRNRVMVNRQRLPRSRDLLGVMRVSVFSPDDLDMIKGGPGERRRFMDDALVALAVKYDSLRLELDRIVKQRNTLLKQVSSTAAGRSGAVDADTELTLDVWDTKMAEVGDRFGHARATLVARLQPLVGEAYEQLAERPSAVELRYEPEWRQVGLAAALVAARRDDVRRGVSTVGPHRDDVELSIGGLPARTHASQGEQRSLALALRLGAHRMVADKVGSAPVLVLDDVLSELDPRRCAALLRHLPAGQVVLTTAGVLPTEAHPDRVLQLP